MKKKLLVSFSGGETSGFLTWWIWNNWQNEYDIIVVFANTGDENLATLLFVHWFEFVFNIPVVWVEAKVDPRYRKPTTHRIVDLYSCSRRGEPFYDVVEKYGIPNRNTPHCNRELKLRPIKSYAKSIWGSSKYYTAIGIRVDEFDRMNADKEKLMLIYPLVKTIPMTKPKINFWWKNQSFRLFLKGYQGNCKSCWKKSFHRLYTIANESEFNFHTFDDIEEKYGTFVPQSRTDKMKKEGKSVELPITFFRGKKSAKDIVAEAKLFSKQIENDADVYDDSESCDIFSGCGDE